MKVYALPLGDYQTNCYIIHEDNENNCILVDPGYQSDDILDVCREKGLSIAAILLTHGHFDHVGAVKELAAETFVEMDSDLQEGLIGRFSDRELSDILDELYINNIHVV